MRLFLCAMLMAAAISISTPPATAEMMRMSPDEPGKVDTYTSDNGRYEVSILYGEGFPSWSLKEDGQELWSQPLMDEPGAASVSDNGETITLPLWGWRDEGGSSGVAVYNKEGKLVREVLFEGELPGEGTLKWVHKRSISPDGKYFTTGESGKEASNVTLFDASTGGIVWEKMVGLPEVDEIKIAKDGKYVIVATHEYGVSDMKFDLLDGEGTVIWSKKIGNNFSYEVEHYIRFKDDGSGFEIYNLASGAYGFQAMPEDNSKKEKT